MKFSQADDRQKHVPDAITVHGSGNHVMTQNKRWAKCPERKMMNAMMRRFVMMAMFGVVLSVPAGRVYAEEETAAPQSIRQQIIKESDHHKDGFIDVTTGGFWKPLNAHLGGFQKVLCWVVSVPAGVLGILFGWFIFPWTLAPIKFLVRAPMDIFIERVIGAVVLGWVAWAASYIFLGLKLV